MEGFWLNYRNGKYAQIREHATDIRDKKVLQKLGVDAKSLLEDIKGLDARKDRAKILILAMKYGLIRVRRHGYQTTFEFYSSQTTESILAEIYAFLRKVGIEGQIAVNNLKKKDFASFSFNSLQDAVKEGDVDRLMKVSKVAVEMLSLAKELLAETE